MARKLFLAGLLAMGVSHLTGCIFWGGSDKVQTPTVGQQVMDLQAAREKGALTEEEFAEKKAALLNKQSENVARTASFKPGTLAKPGSR